MSPLEHLIAIDAEALRTRAETAEKERDALLEEARVVRESFRAVLAMRLKLVRQLVAIVPWTEFVDEDEDESGALEMLRRHSRELRAELSKRDEQLKEALARAEKAEARLLYQATPEEWQQLRDARDQYQSERDQAIRERDDRATSDGIDINQLTSDLEQCRRSLDEETLCALREKSRAEQAERERDEARAEVERLRVADHWAPLTPPEGE